MKKTISIAILVCGTSILPAIAQKSNSVRTNLTAGLAVGDYNATYEKKFTDKISLSTRTNFMSYKGIPFGEYSGFYTFSDAIPGIKSDLRNLGITAGGARPEFRFHRKGQGLSGGYIGLFTSAQFGKTSDLATVYERKNSGGQNVSSDLIFTPSFSYLGGGLSFGKQWVFGSGITIDLTWLSLGFGVSKIQAQASASDMTEQDYADYAAKIEANKLTVGGIGLGAKASYDANGVKASLSQITVVPRILQFGIGFSF